MASTSCQAVRVLKTIEVAVRKRSFSKSAGPSADVIG
jgi:hypothetical protein